MDSQPLKTKPSTRSPLKPQIQTSQESKESEKVEIPEQSKPKEMALVPVLNPIPQSFITIPNVGDTIPSQPIKSPNTVGKTVESTIDIPMTDMPIVGETPVQEEIHQENERTQSNPDLQGQFVSVSSNDKETVESMLLTERDNIDKEIRILILLPLK